MTDNSWIKGTAIFVGATLLMTVVVAAGATHLRKYPLTQCIVAAPWEIPARCKHIFDKKEEAK